MKNKILVLIYLSIFAFSAQANESFYTSLEEKPCKILESSANDPQAEIDYFTMSCPGRDGYKIKVAGGDLRSWLVVLKDNKTVYDSMNDTNTYIGGNFAYISGKVLEWRYDNAKKLIALIVRVGAQDSDNPYKNFSKLFVFSHNNGRFCYVDSHKTNEGAQQIADSKKRCASS